MLSIKSRRMMRIIFTLLIVFASISLLNVHAEALYDEGIDGNNNDYVEEDDIGDPYDEEETNAIAGDPVIEQLEYENQLEFMDPDDATSYTVSRAPLVGDEDDDNFQDAKLKIIQSLVNEFGLDIEDAEEVKVEFVTDSEDLAQLGDDDEEKATISALLAAATRIQKSLQDGTGNTKIFTLGTKNSDTYIAPNLDASREQYEATTPPSVINALSIDTRKTLFDIAVMLNDGHVKHALGRLEEATELFQQVIRDGEQLIRDVSSLETNEPSSATVFKPIVGSAVTALAIINENGPDTNRTRAVELYERGASLGNETAQFRMGVFQASGALGVEKSTADMILNYHFAALGGHSGAQLALGYRYMMGIDVPKKCQVAAKFFELASNVAVDQLEGEEIPGLNERFRLSFDGQHQRTGSEDEDVVDYYRHAAEKGDVNAQIALGQLLYYGARGLSRDMVEARKYFLAAALTGDAMAQATLGYFLMKGLGGPQDIRSAVANFTASAEAQHGAGLNGLGYMHLYGLGVEQDSGKAVSLFNSAADHGSSESCYNLGSLYVTGVGVPRRDYEKAIHYFTLGAQKGHPLSMHKLGQMSLYAIGTHGSCDTAVSLLKQVAERGAWTMELSKTYAKYREGDLEGALQGYLIAAEQGYEVAQSNAAFLLDRGVPLHGGVGNANEENSDDTEMEVGEVDESSDDDMEHDDASGMFDSVLQLFGIDQEWLNQDVVQLVSSVYAANKDILEDLLGVSLENDRIGSRDALRLYEYAADQGNIAARLKIGDYYYYGIGGIEQPDYAQAVYHYRAASDNRDTQAMFNLGIMYEYGYGLPQDFHLSKRFYDMAAATSPVAKYPVTLALGKLWLHKVYRAAMYGEQVKEVPRGILIVAEWLYRVRQGYLSTYGDPTDATESQEDVTTTSDQWSVGAANEWLGGGAEPKVQVESYTWEARDWMELEDDWAIVLFLTFALIVVTYIRWRRTV